MAFLDSIKKLYGNVTSGLSGLLGSHTIEVINEDDEQKKKRQAPNYNSNFVEATSIPDIKVAKNPAQKVAQPKKQKTGPGPLVSPSPTVIAGYDIKSYATDPNHESRIHSIYSRIGDAISPESIDSYIRRIAPNSPINATSVLNAAKKFDVDPKLMIALMQQDSSFGTLGKGARTRNPGNVGNDDTGRLVAYASWDDGVEAVARNLSKRKINGPVEYEPVNIGEETVRQFFSPDTTKETLKKFLVPALQSIPRSVMTIALSTVGKIIPGMKEDNEIRPEEDFGKLGAKLVGKDPIRPFKETGRDFLKTFGAGDKSAEKYGVPIGIGLSVMDLFPSLKGGKSLKVLAETSNVDDVFKILKTESGLADDILKPIAQKVAELTDPKMIEEFLAKTGVELIESGKFALSGVAQKFSTLKESFKAGVKNALRWDELERAYEEIAMNPPTKAVQDVGLFTKLKNTLKPVNSTDEETKTIFTSWSRKSSVAKQLANEALKDLPDIPNKQGLSTILKYEKGEFTPFNSALKETFDDLFKESIERGLNITYRQNYLPQVYKNTTPEIMSAVGKYMKDLGVADDLIQDYLAGIKELPKNISSRLGLNPFFTKERFFPDYATAMKYGLKPRYTNPAQLVAHYRGQMEKALANRELIDKLAAAGKIVPVEIAPRDWKAVEFPFSPKG